MGIERTLRKAGEASVVLGVIDSSTLSSRQDFEAATAEISKLVDLDSQKLIVLANKVDIGGVNKNVIDINNFVLNTDNKPNNLFVLGISAKTGQGLERLRKTLVSASEIASWDGTLVTNARHAQALADTAEALGRVRLGLSNNTPTDLLAEDLRSALPSLGTITGQITTDEVLGEIFGRFCIGK